MDVTLLGSFKLGNKTLKLNQLTSFLAYLVVQNDWVNRSEISFLYWPDVDETKARYNLRMLLARVRKQAWAKSLEVTDHSLRWLVNSDVIRFKKACHEGKWTEACQHYGGSFLEGQLLAKLPSYEDWLEQARQDLAKLWVEASLSAAQELEAAKKFAGAAGYLQAVLKHDPLSETVVQRLMHCFYQDGARQQALKLFTQFKIHLLEEMGVEPSKEAEQLAQVIQEGKPLKLNPTNLPAPITPFFGREQELAYIKNNLQDNTCRLLSIIGLGGIGKTRLAIEAASQLISNFKHGIYLVSFASVNTPDTIIPTIAAALSLNFKATQEPKAQLLDYLREKKMLLVFDNFEHLLSAVVLLSELLREAPHLSIVVTSRERLNLQGEWGLELNGLPVPEEPEKDLEHFSSVQLFLGSARRFNPRLALTPENALAVVNICQLVGGMPLALKLAATWIQTLSLKDIATEIAADPSFLRVDFQDLPERHQSIKAVFEGSWHQLSEAEQSVFKQLSVFCGGFSQKAAEVITDASRRDLLSLNQRSLIMHNPEGRFEIHELLRQYAAEKLSESADQASSHEKHALYYASLLAEKTYQSDQLGFLEETSKELANIQQAWQHFIKQQNFIPLETMLDAFDIYHQMRSLFREIIPFFDGVLQNINALDPQQHLDLKGKILVRKARYLYLLHALEAAERAAQQGLDLLKTDHTSVEQCKALIVLGHIASERNNYRAAKDYYNQSLNIATQIKHQSETYVALNSLGFLAQKQGEFLLAQTYFQDCLGYIETSNLQSRALVLNNLAGIAFKLSDFSKAQYLYEQSLKLRRSLGDPRGIAMVLTNLGCIHDVLGEPDKAKAFHKKSLTLIIPSPLISVE